MAARITENWRRDLPGCLLPRRVIIRFSLDQACREAELELKRLARSPQEEDAAQAFDLLKAITFEAPSASAEMLRDWDHGNASYWLWAPKAH